MEWRPRDKVMTLAIGVLIGIVLMTLFYLVKSWSYPW
jgi:hypothetical protein